ncbi:hypothetical protein [Paenibacillus amylolyticus]|uniref:hypothetical protein n=1 Tax=Paenibacillus amylolyticus TaxID=1451 RepID=UPI00210039A2|nr:hypothetical protein [Paenibacillus amylolyticus]
MNRHTHIGVYGLVAWEGQFLLIHKARGAYQGNGIYQAEGWNLASSQRLLFIVRLKRRRAWPIYK